MAEMDNFVIRPIFIPLLAGRAHSLSEHPDLRMKTNDF